MIPRIILYLTATVMANLLVTHYGIPGLLLSSTLLIPFDFVLRCYFHERWKGIHLVLRLGVLISSGCLATYLINKNAQYVAIGSIAGFAVANIVAGFFYQATIKRSTFIKVNGSDALGVIVDSVVFQMIAFGQFSIMIMLGQSVIKVLGGLFWYYVLFRMGQVSVIGGDDWMPDEECIQGSCCREDQDTACGLCTNGCVRGYRV